MRVSGRRVLITGASRGIGAEVARAFAAAGAKVALVARSEGPLKELAGELDGEAFPADLAEPEQVAGLIERVEAEAGPVDVLVNNAGIDATGWFPAAEPALINATYWVNLVAPVQLCRQVIPRMLERGAGHIVNVSSMAGVVSIPGIVTYSSTKAGLTHFTAVVRADLKGLPVKTTAVEIATVPTDMLANVDDYPPTERAFRRLRRMQLLVDVTTEKVAEAVVSAVEHERRYVRLPKRSMPFALLSGAPRRTMDLLLTGVRPRD